MNAAPPTIAYAGLSTPRRLPPVYRSAAALSQWTIGLLIAMIVTEAVGIVDSVLDLRLLDRAVEQHITTPLARNAFHILLRTIHLTSAWLLAVATPVVFLVWLHRTYRNVQALGAQGLRFSPRWAVAYWFIPILHLFRPFQVVREIWRASNPVGGAHYWQRYRIPAVLNWWWAFWIISGSYGFFLHLLLSGGDTSRQIALVRGVIIEAVLAIASAFLAISVVQAITRRIDERKARQNDVPFAATI